ncbi:MAG: hypothetical protein LH613_14800 [Chamaesiphon sp.]|nr:hypothetical protein [Chamaesiphon sp.]
MIESIEISFSGTNHAGELDISGSPQALRGVSNSILNFIHDKDQIICVIEAAIVDPTPYDICLNSLSICKSNTLIKISVLANSLYIHGSLDNLDSLANSFEFDDDTWSGYHHHVDGWDWIDPDTIPLVIAVKNSIKRPDMVS